MGIGINVMEAHPGAETAERFGETQEPRLALLSGPRAPGMADVEPIGARVLRDDEQFLDASLDQALRLTHHVGDRPAVKPAAQMRDDAEAAPVVAAFGDLQIGVVARREPNALRRQEIEEGILRTRLRPVHLPRHGLVLMRASDGKHVRMRGADTVGFNAEATGDDDLAVLRQCLTDRRKRLLLGAVEEAACVDHHGVGPGIARRQLVALSPEPRDDALRIDERLRTTEADKADLRWG